MNAEIQTLMQDCVRTMKTIREKLSQNKWETKNPEVLEKIIKGHKRQYKLLEEYMMKLIKFNEKIRGVDDPCNCVVFEYLKLKSEFEQCNY